MTPNMAIAAIAVLALACLAPMPAHADLAPALSLANASAATATARAGTGTTATVLPSVAATAADTLDKIRRTNTLVIAFPKSHLPFAALDADGKPQGYAIDICDKVAAAVRRDLRLPQLRVNYLPLDSSARFDALSSGAADIECGSTTNNAARRTQFSFTVPHFYTTTRMMVRKDSGIRGWSDLRAKRVAMVRGSSIVPYVKARDASGVLNVRWTLAASESDAIGMLQHGVVDAYAEDDVLLFSYRSQMQDASAYSIVGEPLSVDAYAMMMRKDDGGFKALVDREMVRMISDHEIYAMYARWFQSPIGAGQRNLGLPMSYLLRDSFHFPSDKVAQ